MQGLVDLAGFITYRGGIRAQKQSFIPVLTGLTVEQLCTCDEFRYHKAKLPRTQQLLGWPTVAKKKLKL